MNNIASLWRYNKDEWCQQFFPEYFELFGGYPEGLRIVYGSPFTPGTKITGNRSCPEMQPWLFRKDGIQPHGVLMEKVESPGLFSRWRSKTTLLSEGAFRDACDKINFFRGNAYKLLDPGALVGAYDVRDDAWRARGKYSLVTGPAGVYTYNNGPLPVNPVGVNATFTKHGSKSPDWIGNLWGPGNFDLPDYIEWNEKLAGPRNQTLEEYNNRRTPQALGYL